MPVASLRRTTRPGGLCIALLALAFVFAGPAAALDLSRERCDVFMGSVCAVLPEGMSVTYEAPLDFRRYTFRENDVVILSVYVGRAPRPVEGTRTINIDEKAFRIEGVRAEQSGKARFDVLFVPKARSAATIHAFAEFDETQRGKVSAVLAGFRPCLQPSLLDLSCPAESNTGEALAKWLGQSPQS